jgi:hypothetical protein
MTTPPLNDAERAFSRRRAERQMGTQKEVFIPIEGFPLQTISSLSHESSTRRCQIEYEFNNNNNYESNESIIVNAIANDVNTLVMNRVYVHVYNVKHNSQMNRNDELSSILFSMKKNCQFSSKSKTTNKMNIENDFIRDENFESIASYAYVNLVVKTKVLSTKEFVSTVQIKVFHVRFDSRSLEIRKQHKKFKKTFRLVVEETENIVSKKTIKKIALKILTSRNHRLNFASFWKFCKSLINSLKKEWFKLLRQSLWTRDSTIIRK